METITRTIGTNKGKARLWLEGAALARAGWLKGKRFDMIEGPISGLLVYKANPSGARAVAGSVDRPIIDTNTDKILNTLHVKRGSVVDVIVTPGSIVITKHID